MKKSKGLGDTVKKLTDKIGIKPCTKCEKRRRYLNRILAYQQSEMEKS
jgi:hypothetical protein